MSGLARYLRLFAPHRAAIGLAALLLAVGASIPGAAVALLGTTLGQVLDHHDSTLLAANAAAFAALLALQAGLDLARTRITKGVALGVASRLRQDLFAHLLVERPAATGPRLSMLLGEVDELQYGVSALVTALRNPLQLLALAVVAARFSPGLALFAPVLLPAVLLPSWLAGRGVREASQAAQRARVATADAAHQSLIGANLIVAFGAASAEASRFGAIEEVDRAARLRQEVVRTVPGAVGQVLAGLAIGVLVWRGGVEVLAGHMGAGELVGFAVALGLMNRPLAGLAEVWTLLQRSLVAADHVLDTVASPPPIVVRDPAVPIPAGPIDLVFEGVAHRWAEAPVLCGVDLHVRSGEIVALQGVTGAGKSTLLLLASRIVDPDAGRVRLGGVDLRDAAPTDVRRAVSLVDQECVLFGRTVGENLRLGRPGASNEDLWSALEAAGAAGLVRGLAGGLDHPVGELGRTLSGGERQRLGLARAFVAGGRVLLLDEATNQVDVATRDAIIAAVRARRAHHAVLWVTHDPAVAAIADRVVRLVDGAVAQ